MNHVAFEAILIIVLLLGNGVLAMAEMAMVSSRKVRLKAMADEGNRGAVAALELAESPNQFLSTVQVGITLTGIFAGAFGGATMAEWLGGQLEGLGLGVSVAQGVGFGLVVLTITYISLIIGELVPKRLALGAPERVACMLAGPMKRLSTVAKPMVWLLGWSTEQVLRLLRVKQPARAHVTGEEVQCLMKEGQQAGIFHQEEPKMVERVLALDELLVKEIMTPRAKTVFVQRDDPHELVWHKIVASEHSHFPVYLENRDHVVGVVSVKSIYANIAAGTPAQIAALMTEPFFVPATQSVARLLQSFRESGRHFAVVADEFGSVVGVVTLVDVLESIVGEVPSQDQRARPDIRKREDGTWLVDGAAEIPALEEKVSGLRFPEDGEREYQTLAGFVLEVLGHIPAEGEQFTAQGWRFEIIDMDRPRIDKVLLTQLSAAR